MRTAPTDCRLVPAAVVCWGTGLVGVRLAPGAAVLAAAVALAIAAVTLAVAHRRPGPARRPGRRGVRAPAAAGHAVLALVVCAATLASAAGQREVREAGLLRVLTAEGASVRVWGTVRSEAVPLRSRSAWGAEEDRYRVDLAVHRVRGDGRTGPAAAPVLVLAGSGWRGVPYGAQVETLGTLQATAPGDAAVALLVVRGPPTLVRPPGAVHRGVATVRQALLAASDGLPPDQRGLVPGAAIGDVSRVPDDLDTAMRTSGLTHVTAVSGAHFAIIGAAVLGLTAVIGLPRGLRAGVVASAMVGFVLLVHPGPSVLRAAVMGAVGVWALVLGRPARSVPALATCVVVLLVLDPWWSTSIGFALSVGATAGIVLLTGPLARGLASVLPERAARAVAVPLAAQCACGPLVVTLSTGLSTYAVPANVVAAPALVPATVLGVLAALIAPWWPGGGAACAAAAGWATGWVAGVARLFAGLPASELPWPEGPAGPALLAVATAGAVLAVVRLRGPRHGARPRDREARGGGSSDGGRVADDRGADDRQGRGPGPPRDPR